MIVILSPNYLNAVYPHPEWAAVFAKDPMGKKRLLIPVMVKKCNLEGLLAQIVYIKLYDIPVDQMRSVFLNEMKKSVMNVEKNIVENEIKSKDITSEMDKTTPLINQRIEGDSNIQIGNVSGDVILKPKSKSVRIKISPPPGIIGSDPDRRSYVKHLIDRYHEYKEADRMQEMKYVIIYQSIKRKFKCKWDYIPLERFDELVAYLQDRIDKTILGRNYKKQNRKRYISFDEYLAKRRKLT